MIIKGNSQSESVDWWFDYAYLRLFDQNTDVLTSQQKFQHHVDEYQCQPVPTGQIINFSL